MSRRPSGVQQSSLSVRKTQKGACFLAGQADCSAVKLEGGLPPSNNPRTSEFLKNSEMSSYALALARRSDLLLSQSVPLKRLKDFL